MHYVFTLWLQLLEKQCSMTVQFYCWLFKRVNNFSFIRCIKCIPFLDFVSLFFICVISLLRFTKAHNWKAIFPHLNVISCVVIRYSDFYNFSQLWCTYYMYLYEVRAPSVKNHIITYCRFLKLQSLYCKKISVLLPSHKYSKNTKTY